MEKLRSDQEQTLETLDTRTDAMMERRTQAIMDKLGELLGDSGGLKNRGANSGEPNRDPRVNFIEQTSRRKTYGSTRGRGSSSSYATGDNKQRGPNIRKGSTGIDRRQTNDQHEMQIRLGDLIPQSGVMRIKEEFNQVTRTGGKLRSPYWRTSTLKLQRLNL